MTDFFDESRTNRSHTSKDYRDESSGELALTLPDSQPALDSDAARAKALQGSPEDRAAFLDDDVFIQTPDFRYVTGVVECLLQRAPRFTNPGGLRIVADSGMGKDAIIRYLLRKFRPSWSDGKLRYPLLHIHFEARPTPAQIIRHFLDQLGVAHSSGHLLRDLRKLLLDAMAECRTVGILFNEAQHLLYSSEKTKRTTGREAGETGDWLKRFLEDARRPAVFLGIPAAWDQLIENDPQLRTRFRNRYEIHEFNYDSQFLGVLKALDAAIPMPEPAGLANPELASDLYQVTNGNWRSLIQLLEEAVISASQAGAARIERQDLSVAYQIKISSIGNPFGDARQR